MMVVCVVPVCCEACPRRLSKCCSKLGRLEDGLATARASEEYVLKAFQGRQKLGSLGMPCRELGIMLVA